MHLHIFIWCYGWSCPSERQIIKKSQLILTVHQSKIHSFFVLHLPALKYCFCGVPVVCRTFFQMLMICHFILVSSPAVIDWHICFLSLLTPDFKTSEADIFLSEKIFSGVSQRSEDVLRWSVGSHESRSKVYTSVS